MPIYWQQTTSVDTPRHPSLSWANFKNWKFIAWNREKQVEEEIKLPESFILVAEWWSIKWRLENKGSVWSNEIYSFSKDPLTVRSWNGEILYEWYYKDLKDKLRSVGLKPVKNCHYVDPEKPDELRTFCIKGAALKEWMNLFSDDNRFAAGNHLVCFNKVEKGKTWAVTYTFPTFTICDELTQEQKNIQTDWWVKLAAYQERVNATADEIQNEKVAKEDDLELPFN